MYAICILLIVLAPVPSPQVAVVEPHHVVGTWEWLLIEGKTTVRKYHYRVYFAEDGTYKKYILNRHGGCEKGTWRLDSRDGTLRVRQDEVEIKLSFRRMDNGFYNRRFATVNWEEPWEGRSLFHAVEVRKR